MCEPLTLYKFILDFRRVGSDNKACSLVVYAKTQINSRDDISVVCDSTNIKQEPDRLIIEGRLYCWSRFNMQTLSVVSCIRSEWKISEKFPLGNRKKERDVTSGALVYMTLLWFIGSIIYPSACFYLFSIPTHIFAFSLSSNYWQIPQ